MFFALDTTLLKTELNSFTLCNSFGTLPACNNLLFLPSIQSPHSTGHPAVLNICLSAKLQCLIGALFACVPKMEVITIKHVNGLCQKFSSQLGPVKESFWFALWNYSMFSNGLALEAGS